MTIDEVRVLLETMDQRARERVIHMIRDDFGVVLHPLEAEWHTRAEAILEAIHSSPDLTQRGIRGILAEATFRTIVAPALDGWKDVTFEGAQAHDLLLRRGTQSVRIQVKQQRRERQAPMLYSRRGYTNLGDVYVVETQRTRTGMKRTTGEATRPYRKDEFDVLAVCLQAIRQDWRSFIYCPTSRLLIRPDAPALLQVMQPVYLDGSHGWTEDFEEAVAGIDSVSPPEDH